MCARCCISIPEEYIYNVDTLNRHTHGFVYLPYIQHVHTRGIRFVTYPKTFRIPSWCPGTMVPHLNYTVVVDNEPHVGLTSRWDPPSAGCESYVSVNVGVRSLGSGSQTSLNLPKPLLSPRGGARAPSPGSGARTTAMNSSSVLSAGRYAVRPSY